MREHYERKLWNKNNFFFKRGFPVDLFEMKLCILTKSQRGISMRIIISTCKPEEAEMIADTLLEERLIASCNIVNNTVTKVRWKGEHVTQTEALLIMRTRTELIWKLERRMIELNTFEVPEVASIEVKEWNAKYYNWLYESTENPGPKKSQ